MRGRKDREKEIENVNKSEIKTEREVDRRCMKVRRERKKEVINSKKSDM